MNDFENIIFWLVGSIFHLCSVTQKSTLKLPPKVPFYHKTHLSYLTTSIVYIAVYVVVVTTEITQSCGVHIKHAVHVHLLKLMPISNCEIL